MLMSFDSVVRSGRRLTGNQLRWLKIMVNRMWYDTKIKGTSADLMSRCEEILKPVFSAVGGISTTDFDSIEAVESFVDNESREIKMAWNLYKIKNAIVR